MSTISPFDTRAAKGAVDETETKAIGDRELLRAGDGVIAELRATLDGLLRENLELRHELRRLKLENERLQEAAAIRSMQSDRAGLVRSMLRAPTSRNP